MSLPTLTGHPELFPGGIAGVALLAALLGKVLGVTWAEHHPRPLAAASSGREPC